MEKLSRVKKYAQLREELMNDAESEVSSSELSEFAKRLNRIDSNQFNAMETSDNTEHDPVHLRRESYFEEPVKKECNVEDTFSSFNNEYLDEYINEVKQYNQVHGYSSSEDTAKNILNTFKKEITSLDELDIMPSFDETTEIPVFGKKEDPSLISVEVKNLLNSINLSKDETSVHKDDNIKRNEPLTFIDYTDSPMPLEVKGEENDFEKELKKEKELRERLMNETVQMRAQLDDYDKELSEVNDSVMHANQVLNIVLIILILVMLAVAGILIYYILLDRGVI